MLAEPVVASVDYEVVHQTLFPTTKKKFLLTVVKNCHLFSKAALLGRCYILKLILLDRSKQGWKSGREGKGTFLMGKRRDWEENSAGRVGSGSEFGGKRERAVPECFPFFSRIFLVYFSEFFKFFSPFFSFFATIYFFHLRFCFQKLFYSRGRIMFRRSDQVFYFEKLTWRIN